MDILMFRGKRQEKSCYKDRYKAAPTAVHSEYSLVKKVETWGNGTVNLYINRYRLQLDEPVPSLEQFWYSVLRSNKHIQVSMFSSLSPLYRQLMPVSNLRVLFKVQFSEWFSLKYVRLQDVIVLKADVFCWVFLSHLKQFRNITSLLAIKSMSDIFEARHDWLAYHSLFYFLG